MKNKIAKCGTRSGYNRHLRLKELVCGDCRQAQRDYDLKKFYENPELKRKRNRIHSNPDKKREAWRRREAKRRGSLVEKYSEKEVLKKYGTDCYICKRPIDFFAPRRSGMGNNWENGLHIDHVVPISAGGSDTINNVRPTHGLCNIKKGKRL
jgi:5-methylcytosine-specific restriction endonuclease McrA